MTAPNWVRARAECTLERSFAEVEKAIRDDVAKFNSLATENRRSRLFVVEVRDGGIEIRRARRSENPRGPRLIADPDRDQDFVRVSHGNGEIVAQRQDRDPLTISPQWTADTLSCDLYIGDRVFPLWNVSERILEPFLFGED